jgi:hypothetical protein
VSTGGILRVEGRKGRASDVIISVLVLESGGYGGKLYFWVGVDAVQVGVRVEQEGSRVLFAVVRVVMVVVIEEGGSAGRRRRGG